jgi:hypothetical protein
MSLASVHRTFARLGLVAAVALSLIVQEARIRYRYIKPRLPEQNGKVERSHRTDPEAR